MTGLLARASIVVAGALIVGPLTQGRPGVRYDLVIAGGTIIDGTGRGGQFADVAITDGRIAAIGRIPSR
jgi:urease alpha subunit